MLDSKAIARVDVEDQAIGAARANWLKRNRIGLPCLIVVALGLLAGALVAGQSATILQTIAIAAVLTIAIAGRLLWQAQRCLWELSAEKKRLSDMAAEQTEDLQAANARLEAEIAVRRESEAHTLHLLEHDALTSLPNRRFLMRHLADVLDDHEGEQIAVMMLDLDRFKEINDTLGHPAGDELLRQAATRLGRVTDTGDCAARMGGDEFALVSCKIRDNQHAAERAESVLRAFREPFSLSGSRNVHARASIGVALHPEHGSDADTLLSHADLALYEAKSFGRGRYSLYSTELHEATQARRSTERELRHALEAEQFHLCYQPRFSLQKRRIVGVEALLRWQHPERGELLPADFVPVAETSGQIAAIGNWALMAACKQAHAWELAGYQVNLSVNMSAVQFRQLDLARQILEALNESALSPERLELEITENVCMRTVSGNIERELQRIKGMGVRLAIDNFGTGYSSLAYLKWLPFDILKIDRSFVAAITSDDRDRAVVKTGITLAQSLGKSAVAVGIEDDAQLDAILELGCDEAQGFLFGRPMPPEDLVGLLHG